MRKILSAIGSVALSVFLLVAPAHARKAKATYDGDPNAETYIAVSEVVFKSYEQYECGITKVEWSATRLNKYRQKANLPASTDVMSGKCAMKVRTCFVGDRGRGQACFDYAKVEISNIKFKKDDTYAIAAWNYLFLKQEPEGNDKYEGIVMRKIFLEKQDDGWVIVDTQHNFTEDFR